MATVPQTILDALQKAEDSKAASVTADASSASAIAAAATAQQQAAAAHTQYQTDVSALLAAVQAEFAQQ